MSWNSVIGQEQQVRVLRSALLGGRLAHAYLFSGPEGTGKEMVAFELAKALSCTISGSSPEGACGNCADCREMDKLLHPNVEYLFPVESALLEGSDSPKKDNRKFTETKERYDTLLEQKKANPYFTPCMDRSMGILTEQVIQLQQKASFMPREGSRKVFIISQADRLHPSAANKLLKLLEEPPPHVLFVLVSSRPESLLATIRSRCQEIVFQRIPEKELRSWMEEHKADIPPDERESIVKASRGSLCRAWELMLNRMEAGFEPAEKAIRTKALDYLRSILMAGHFHKAILSAEEQTKNLSRQELILFISSILLFLQDAMHRRIDPGFSNLNNPDIADAVDRFARNFPNPDLMEISTIAEESIRSLERNAGSLLVMAAFTAQLRPLITRPVKPEN